MIGARIGEGTIGTMTETPSAGEDRDRDRGPGTEIKAEDAVIATTVPDRDRETAENGHEAEIEETLIGGRGGGAIPKKD